MKTRKKYLIASAIAALICVFMLYLYDIGNAQGLAQIYKILADSFTLPGILFLALGSLVWVESTGAIDGIAYALGRAGRMLIPFSKKNNETFYDYKTRKAENRSGGYGFLLIVGAAFLAISVIFIVLFYTV